MHMNAIDPPHQTPINEILSKPIRFERLLDKIESSLLKGAIAR